MDLAEKVKEAMEVEAKSFCELVENATRILQEEQGRLGNLFIRGKLVQKEPTGDSVVIGDIHGDLESLLHVIQESNVVTRLNEVEDLILVFLGDYGDRGAFPVEVYYIVLTLKVLYPSKVILLRGNHEFFWIDGSGEVGPSPHDLPDQFRRRLGKQWNDAYRDIRKLFEELFTGLIVEKRYLMIHGGLSSRATSREQLARAHVSEEQRISLQDILWSDPDENAEDTSSSPRGAGVLFGRAVTERVLKDLGVEIMIRGHESAPEGFKINHNGRVLTLFSRKGSPYFNENGAYLDVPLTLKLTNAEQLLPYVHRF